MSKWATGWLFSRGNDEQMSNTVRVAHWPVKQHHFVMKTDAGDAREGFLLGFISYLQQRHGDCLPRKIQARFLCWKNTITRISLKSAHEMSFCLAIVDDIPTRIHQTDFILIVFCWSMWVNIPVPWMLWVFIQIFTHSHSQHSHKIHVKVNIQKCPDVHPCMS